MNLLARSLIVLVGIAEALLVARFVARALAARPDNFAVQTLYALTEPLLVPLRFLDAQQPRFGSVLELSTLSMLVLVLVVGYIVWQFAYTATGGDNERPD